MTGARTMSLRSAWVIPAVLIISAPSWAAPAPKAPANTERATELVKALGDPSFRVREQASRDLLQLGRSAYPALMAGTQDSSPEIRLRCRRLLPSIFALEMRARLEDFVNDTDPSNDHGLVGWKRYRHVAGADQAARTLFTGMVKSDPQLMESVETQPNIAPHE